MSSVLHLALLGLAVSSLAAASLRCAARLCLALDARILGATALGAGFAIAEPLLLGLTGHGANPYLLTGAAVLTWLLSRVLVPTPATPVRHQLATAWSGCAAAGRGCIGAFAGLAVGTTIYQMTHPRIGWDGVVYHVAQPAIWIGDGHPGSLHQTVNNFPTQAYPKSFELLVFWVSAISRTMTTLVPLMMALNLLAIVAMLIGLRRVGCRIEIAALATAAALIIPWDLIEFGNVYDDLPALAFLAVAVTLCVIAQGEPAALGLAVVAAGVAISIKTTTVPIAVIAIAWAGYRLGRRLRPHITSLTVLAAVGSGLAILWYAVNAAKYGAPLWPFSSWPDGPPLPFIWQNFGARFIDEPLATMRAFGWHRYLHYLAGVPLLLAAVPVIVGLCLLPARGPDVDAPRVSRRSILICGGVVVIQTVAWSAAQFTGISPASPAFALSGLRYLDEAPAAAAALLAVTSLRRGVARPVAVALLAAALVIDLIEARHVVAGLIPPLWICALLVVAGALLGVLAGHRSRVKLVFLTPYFAPSAAMVAALAIAAPAPSYLTHYISSAPYSGRTEAAILHFLRTQPGWAHGAAPVAAGPTADATFAGPDFTHPLSYVPADVSCAALRTTAQHGWLILQAAPGGPWPELTYGSMASCLKGIPPVIRLPGRVRIYAPANLVTPLTP